MEEYYFIRHSIRGDFSSFSKAQAFPPMPIFVDDESRRRKFESIQAARGTFVSLPDSTKRLCEIVHHPFGKVVV